MIWVNGEIVADDALKISVLDRTFEHGLGLFETLRTWNGRAVLLDRHLARMQKAAKRLRLPLDPLALPDAEAVTGLLAANRFDEDARLRITMSGGLSEKLGAVIWMTARELLSPWPISGIELVRQGIYNDPHDIQTRYKTLNYWNRRLAAERATSSSEFSPYPREALLTSHDGRVWEGSRTNIFAVRHGIIITPGHPGPFVPGIMRDLVIERANSIGLKVRMENLTFDCLRTAGEIFMTNAVRGIIPVRKIEGREFEMPGPLTLKIRSEVWGWLNRGGIDA